MIAQLMMILRLINSNASILVEDNIILIFNQQESPTSPKGTKKKKKSLKEAVIKTGIISPKSLSDQETEVVSLI